MFYINEVIKIFKEHFVLSITSMVSLAALVMTLHFSGDIKSIFTPQTKTLSNPYFNAVMTKSENPDYIKRKMSDLPGVFAVNVNKSDLRQRLKSFVGQDIKSFGDSFLSKSYYSIKVLFETNISENTKNLVKEYLKRLVGKDGVSVSQVKYPSKKKAIISKNSFLGNWADKMIFGFFALIWFATLWLLKKHANNQAFIIEQFQRKKFVLPKLYMNSTLGVILACLILSFSLNKNINLIDGVLLLATWIIGLAMFYNSKTKVKRYI